MLFNTLEYGLFFAAVLIGYFSLASGAEVVRSGAAISWTGNEGPSSRRVIARPDRHRFLAGWQFSAPANGICGDDCKRCWGSASAANSPFLDFSSISTLISIRWNSIDRQQRLARSPSVSTPVSLVFGPARWSIYLEHLWLPTAHPCVVVQGIRYGELLPSPRARKEQDIYSGPVERRWHNPTPVNRLEAALLQRVHLLRTEARCPAGAWRTSKDGRERTPTTTRESLPIREGGRRGCRHWMSSGRAAGSLPNVRTPASFPPKVVRHSSRFARARAARTRRARATYSSMYRSTRTAGLRRMGRRDTALSSAQLRNSPRRKDLSSWCHGKRAGPFRE